MQESFLKSGISNNKLTHVSKGPLLPPYIVNRRTKESALPIIDISGLDHKNPKIRRITALEIGEIAETTGFLYLSNHGVDSEEIHRVYKFSEEFFSQNIEKKNLSYVGNHVNHRGYVPTTEKGNYADEIGERRYEAFDMAMDLPATDPDYLKGNPLLGPNVWPDIPGFREALSSYYNQMRRLSLIMCKAFEIAMHVPQGFLSQHMNKPISQLRLIHYLEKKKSTIPKSVNMGAHTDYECFTILHSNTPGLQILNLDDEWINAPPIQNTFYFNIGDMLELWSNGRFVSTPHRVADNGSERYSIPYFAATDYNTIIKPLETNGLSFNNRNQQNYNPIMAGKHLLTQMLRDFPYLNKRYEQGLLKQHIHKTKKNPFESRIKQVTEVH